VKQLARYLFDKIVIDISGTDIEEIRAMLREEDSQESRALLAKLIEERGLEELELTVADCLKDEIRNGISEDTIARQLSMYSES
jgi:hypothetical protein